MVQTWLGELTLLIVFSGNTESQIAVTGASSGAGKAVTEEVLAQGGNVVAAVRNPSSLDDLSSKYSKQLVAVKCDVTVQTDVDAAFAAAKEHFGRLDAVWNNAGYSVVAEIEAAPIDDAKALFEVSILSEILDDSDRFS